MMISAIVAGFILLGTAATISKVHSQNMEPEFARQDLELIKAEAQQINITSDKERSEFRSYVKSQSKYKSDIDYWSDEECFNISLSSENGEYHLNCAGNRSTTTTPSPPVSVVDVLLELVSLSDFESKGSYALSSADRADNSGNLGIGYQNGTSGDPLRGFWRLDMESSSYSVTEVNTYNNYWRPGSNPDFNIHKVESDLTYNNPSSTTVTVNASNNNMGTWTTEVELWNYTSSSPSWTQNSIGTSTGAIEAIVPADIDHDGDTDIVYGSASENTVKFAENDGTGGGWAKTKIGDQDVESVSVGDIDGDGDLDVVGGGNGNNIYFFENENGDGSSWQRHTIGTTGNTVRSVALGDLDSDGDLDIAYSDFGSDAEWFENDGSDTGWSSNTIGSTQGNGWTIAVADIDQDQHLDVITGDDGHNLRWHENDGSPNPSFSTETIVNLDEPIFSLAVADIDNSGTMDILFGESDSDVELLRNTNGDGSNWDSTEIGEHSGTNIRSLQVADLDQDGYKDVIAGVNGGNDIDPEWFENDGTGSGWNQYSIGNTGDSGHYGLAVADVNGDRVPDIITGEDDSSANLRLRETQGISTTYLGSDHISFTNSNGGSKDATITWTPKQANYNLIARVNPQRNYTEVFETNDETAGVINNRVLQSVSGSDTVKDYSGQNNDGSTNNFDGDERGSDGVFSTNSFQFDGDDDFVRVDSFDSNTDPVTVSYWAYIPTGSQDKWSRTVQIGGSATNSPTDGFSHENNPGGGSPDKLKIVHWNGGSMEDVYNNIDVNTDSWNHITQVIGNSRTWFYVNGNQVASGPADKGPDTDQPVMLGAGDDHYWHGRLDEVRLYNRNLSKSEVRDHYFRGVSGDYRGNYTSVSKNLNSGYSLDKLGVKASVPTGTSADVLVEHSSGADQLLPISDGYTNYSLSIGSTGGSASAKVIMDSSTPVNTTVIEELRLWTSN